MREHYFSVSAKKIIDTPSITFRLDSTDRQPSIYVIFLRSLSSIRCSTIVQVYIYSAAHFSCLIRARIIKRRLFNERVDGLIGPSPWKASTFTLDQNKWKELLRTVVEEFALTLVHVVVNFSATFVELRSVATAF